MATSIDITIRKFKSQIEMLEKKIEAENLRYETYKRRLSDKELNAIKKSIYQMSSEKKILEDEIERYELLAVASYGRSEEDTKLQSTDERIIKDQKHIYELKYGNSTNAKIIEDLNDLNDRIGYAKTFYNSAVDMKKKSNPKLRDEEIIITAKEFPSLQKRIDEIFTIAKNNNIKIDFVPNSDNLGITIVTLYKIINYQLTEAKANDKALPNKNTTNFEAEVEKLENMQERRMNGFFGGRISKSLSDAHKLSEAMADQRLAEDHKQKEGKVIKESAKSSNKLNDRIAKLRKKFINSQAIIEQKKKGR